jgi:hypothetical protein
MDESITKGLFHWRESYKDQAEHAGEAFKDLQDDCNALMQQGSSAKTPYDLMLAWNKFSSHRITHMTNAFSRNMKSSLDWTSLLPQSTTK